MALMAVRRLKQSHFDCNDIHPPSTRTGWHRSIILNEFFLFCIIYICDLIDQILSQCKWVELASKINTALLVGTHFSTIIMSRITSL